MLKILKKLRAANLNSEFTNSYKKCISSGVARVLAAYKIRLTIKLSPPILQL